MKAQEEDMDIQIKEETEDPLLEEQDTEKYFLKSNIDIRHNFATCQDKADNAFYHQLAKCESVSSFSDVKIKKEIEDEDECARYENKTSQEILFVKCEPQSSDVEDDSESSTEETSDNKQYAHCESISTLRNAKDGGLSGTSEDQNQNSGIQNQNSGYQNQISENQNQNSNDAFKCSVCNKQFTCRQYLQRHLKRHVNRHQVQEFVFVKCEIQSSDVDEDDPSVTSKDLSESRTEKTSFITHSHIKRYVNCESVSTISDVQNGGINGTSEDQNQNSGDQNQNSGNQNQNSGDQNQNSRYQNQINENQNSNGANKCTVCNKQFSRRENLVRHIKLHANLKKFNCSECNKQFTFKEKLVRHMKTHTGVKEFNCSDCNKSFTCKENLVRHMKTHTGVKEFNCSVCCKQFSRKENLVRHMKFHSGVKEFNCSVCNKQFSQKGNLTTHMNLHSGEKVYECTICDKKYLHKVSLKFHLKTHN